MRSKAAGWDWRRDFEERFRAKVTVLDSACWLWRGSKDQDGYGKIRADGRDHRAHRLAYEWFIGPVPEGLVLDHLCRNHECVNPHHLEPVTTAENLARGDTLNAANIRKVICPYGHPYSTENTYLSPDGRRHCRTCGRRAKARHKAKRAAIA